MIEQKYSSYTTLQPTNTATYQKQYQLGDLSKGGVLAMTEIGQREWYHDRVRAPTKKGNRCTSKHCIIELYMNGLLITLTIPRCLPERSPWP